MAGTARPLRVRRVPVARATQVETAVFLAELIIESFDWKTLSLINLGFGAAHVKAR
jgi:hypothetical protein